MGSAGRYHRKQPQSLGGLGRDPVGGVNFRILSKLLIMYMFGPWEIAAFQWSRGYQLELLVPNNVRQESN